MLPAQNQRLIARGIAQIRAFNPAEIVFAGFPEVSVPVANRSGASTLVLDEGFEGSEPQTFLILKSLLPNALVIVPKRTRFTFQEKTWKVITVSGETSEPHIHITANIPTAR